MPVTAVRVGRAVASPGVNVVVGALVVVAVTAVAVAVMLLMRRSAPEGSYFTDGDRASGVFGVLATGFSVLLGFIIFLAFTSYDQSRTGAETEALTSCSRSRTRAVPPGAGRGELAGELVCYGRSVVNDEWQRMRTARSAMRSTRGASSSSETLERRAGHGERAVRLRQVARPDLDARGGTAGPGPRRRGRDPVDALDRPLLHRRGDLRLHALLRRPRRARARPGDADGLGRLGDRGACCCSCMRSTTRSMRASAGSSRSRWSDRCVSSTRRSRPSARRCRSRATSKGRPLGAVTADASRNEGRLELVATVLLALATVATAWSGYQASRWNGEQAKAAARASAARIESVKAEGLANAQIPDRRRGLHAVGECVRAGADGAAPTSTSSASGPSSGPRWTPGSRRGRSRTPTRL